jgi:DNA-binding NarL/FixJ family response regulator
MRVVIAEDQVLLREGLARLFEDGGHEVVASLPDAEHLAAAIAGHRPDLVVLDVRMPPSFTDEGARAAKEIKEQHPELGVLVLSQHVETAHAVELVSQGGFGYLLKNRVLDVGAFLAAGQRGGRSARRALGARARGARADGGGVDQRGHREAAGPERAHGGGARAQRADEALDSRERRCAPAGARRPRPPHLGADPVLALSED